MLIYNYRINSAQINIVNSYLAAKYGLTIDNDKYSFDATHKYDVAGIGRTTPGNTNTSATSARILNISSPTSLGDNEYLLFGHDNASIASWDNEAPAGIVKIPREWRLNETGNVGSVTVTADLSSFPPALCSKYVLLIDTDGDFTNATVYDLAPAGTNLYSRTGVSVSDGNYMSIGVRKAPTVSITPDPSGICAGTTLNLNGNPAGGSGVYTHSWTGNTSPLSSTSIPDPTFSTSTPNTYNLTYTVTDNKGCSASDAISVTVAPVPAISAAPSDITVCNGATPTLSVTASGGIPVLSYQWEESDDNGISDPWTNAAGGSGSATAIYTAPPLSSNIFYRVVVSASGAGCSAVTSAGAKVTVVPDLSITTQPSGGTVCYNSVLPLSIAVTGGGTLSYQWEVSPDGTGSWTAVGTDSPAYTTPPVTADKYYRVIVSSTASGCTTPLTSTVAAVLMESANPVITGSIPASTVEGCSASDATPAVNNVADLELLGLNISDACTPDGSLVVTHDDVSLGNCTITVTRTYKVTDEEGNYSTYDQTIVVDDTQGPVVAGTLSETTVEGCSSADAPAAVTTAADLAALPGNLSIADACTPDASLIVSHTDDVVPGCPTVITRTYTVTDECSHSVNIIHTLKVEDTQPPVISGTLTQVTVQGCGTADAPAAVTTVAGLELLPGGIGITDGCIPKASLVVTHSDAPGGSCPWVITRTYTVEDECGNFATIDQIIHVEDTQAPVVTGSLSLVTVEGCNVGALPPEANTVAELESLAGSITIADDCTPKATLTVAHSDSPGAGQCPRVVIRTYKVSDDCGNFVNIDQTIQIMDTQPPVVTGTLTDIVTEGCGASDAPAAETTVAGLEALPGGVSITDICTLGIAMTVTHSDSESASNCPLVITRTYTVSDPCTNAVTLTQKITVTDTQGPVVSGSLSVTNVEGCNSSAAPAAVTTVAELVALPGDLAVSDACTPDASLIVSHSDAVVPGCPTVITRTYTITDECSHSVNIVHTINVDDIEAPVVTGSLTSTTVEGCDESAAPAAATTVAGLEALDGSITITDACTTKASLTVTHSDVSSEECPKKLSGHIR